MRRSAVPVLLTGLAVLVAACSSSTTTRSTAVGVGAGVAATPAPSRVAPGVPADITPMMLALGDSLFNAGACQRCHGQKGVGGQRGPSLITGPWLHGDGSFDAIVATITNGVPRAQMKDSTRTPMRARGGPMNLDDAQVRAIAAYVVSISRNKG